MTWSIIESDALAALRAMPDASFDACLTDPPYGLGQREPTLAEIVAYLTQDAELDMRGDFMGKDWSVPSVAVWRELFRVLKPGAHALVFTGTRTQDLISIGLRAAGFEIRDAIDWVYASGMPKSLQVERAVSMIFCHHVGRHFMSALPHEKKRLVGDHVCPIALEGEPFEEHGTGLKPSREPVIVARKPLDSTIAACAIEHGTGGLNIDRCRLARRADDRFEYGRQTQLDRTQQSAYGEIALSTAYDPSSGRWPSNLILSHAEECRPVGTRRVRTGVAVRHRGVVGPRGEGFGIAKPEGTPDLGYADEDGLERVEKWECVPGCPISELDRQSGDVAGGRPVPADTPSSPLGGHVFSHAMQRTPFEGYNDSGGASRFFFCAKASRAEREFGCDLLPARKAAETLGREEGSAGLTARAGAGRSADTVKNFGPCVKPLKLTKWLATLPLPPKRATPRRLLNLYSGTGSEMVGALRAGWDEVVGIQRVSDDDERAYVAIAKARIARWLEVPDSLDEGEACAEAEEAPPEQTSLFG